MYPFIERTILQYQAMQEKAMEIKGLETGIIRVETITSVTCHWMPMLIKGFQQLYPNVQFVFHDGDYTSIQEWIKTGLVDFGFISPSAVTGLETIKIKDGEMLAVLPKNHPLAQNTKIPLAALTQEPFILLEEGHYNEPLEAFHAAGLKPDIKYTVHDDFAIMTMVEAGLGVGILAKLELSEEEEEQAKKDMSRMLDYIDQLNELDTSGVEPMSHIFPVQNVFREDVVTNGDSREAILSNAPEQKDGAFKVPKTVEQ